MVAMPYIIDGHNLIAKIPGLSLRDIDDEDQLLEMLQDFCRRQRKKAEVYFDNAPPGELRVRKYGSVTAHYIRSGGTADDAIHARLGRLGRAARNWRVVSSDQTVQASAKAAKAQVLSSETFARDLIEIEEDSPDGGDIKDTGLSSHEVDDWLLIFGEGKTDE